jgi:transposase
MDIIGCDLHWRYQVVAWVNQETGEVRTRRLEHENGEAKRFYVGLPRGARVGIEATIPALWFERLLGECGHQRWVGDAAKIRASETRKQKTDGRDAGHILDLLLANRFPRIWTPPGEDRDLRQLLVHRMKLVRTRTAVKNQLHYLAISQGMCRKHKRWTEKGRGAGARALGRPAAGEGCRCLYSWYPS